MQTPITTDRDLAPNIFQYQSKLHKEAPNFKCNLIANINTKSQNILNSPEISMITNVLNVTLIGIKGALAIDIIQIIQGDVSIKGELVYDLKNEEGYIETTFIILPMRANLEFLIGFENGSILHYGFEGQIMLKHFNRNSSFKDKAVTKIIMDPIENNVFIVLFKDSTIFKYSLNPEDKESDYFLTQLEKFEKKTNFNPKFNKFIYRHKENDLLEKKSVITIEAPELDAFIANNKCNNFVNPISYAKYNCNFISDLIVKKNSSQHSLKTQISKKDGSNCLLAYVGFDGYLRIFDYHWNTPLLSFKSYYGGFNSLEMSQDGNLIIIGCQSDEIIVFDLKSLRILSILGHKSFITRTISINVEEFVIRIFATSMDCNVSISEFDVRIFQFEDENEKKIREEEINKFPKQVFLRENGKINLKPLILHKFAEDSIGFLEISSSYIATSSMDSNVTIWKFMNNERGKGAESTKDTDDSVSERVDQRE